MDGKPSFRNIEEEIGNILELSDGELTPETLAEIDKYLDELGTQEARKVDGYAQFRRMKKAMADAKRTEAQRLLASARSDEACVAYMDRHYLSEMEQRGLRRIKGDSYTISVRSTKVVLITDEKAIPDEWATVVTERKIDKRGILEQLKAGVEIPGCTLGENLSLQAR